MIQRRSGNRRNVLALSGGVGGAKLVCGLARVLPPGVLTTVGNTGDDFEHLGLHISPDIDTLTYALAGLQNKQTGWGRCDETWSFMKALGDLGGETWFKLGDRDLALHMERTRRLKSGQRLSHVTSDIACLLGVSSRILPMTDDRVRTKVVTDDGILEFQRYFVEAQCLPKVTGFIFEGADQARPHPDIIAAMKDPHLRTIVLCPSNPFISIGPMLAIAGLRSALAATEAPVIAVSPIIGGHAVKGPTAKMMKELGLQVNAAAVASHYRGLIDGFVLDAVDASLAECIEVPVDVRSTIMRDQADCESLARAVIDFADRLNSAD